MALIKCVECGKEISDKALMCVHCGKKFKKTNNIKVSVGVKLWLILCIISCFIISIFSFLVVLSRLFTILSILLGVVYIILFKTITKKNFYILIGINCLIIICALLFPVSYTYNITSLIYIFLAIINSLITYLVIKEYLKKECNKCH